MDNSGNDDGIIRLQFGKINGWIYTLHVTTTKNRNSRWKQNVNLKSKIRKELEEHGIFKNNLSSGEDFPKYCTKL